MTVAWSKMAIFSAFGRYIFENFRDNAKITIWYYVVPHWLSAALTWKQITLHDGEIKFCFQAGMSRVGNLWIPETTV